MKSEFFSFTMALGLPECFIPLLIGPELLFPSHYSQLCLSDIIRVAREKEVLKCNGTIKSDKYFFYFNPQSIRKNSYYHLTSGSNGAFIFLSHLTHRLHK